MAKHRSAFQLLKEANLKISKLKERVAREVVSDHKDIKAFDFKIKSVQQELTKVRRWTNEDNGLVARIGKLQEQIAVCEENLATAHTQQANLEQEITSLKDDRRVRAGEVLESQDIDIESLIEDDLDG